MKKYLRLTLFVAKTTWEEDNFANFLLVTGVLRAEELCIDDVFKSCEVSK